MQILLSLPGLDEIEAAGGVEHSLFRHVCGIPLLARVIATAGRSGGTEVLLLHPKTVPEEWLKAGLNSAVLSSIPVHTLALDRAFDPDNPSDWQAIENRLEAKFLWLPWNYVVDKKTLSRMIEAGQASNEGVRFEWSEGSDQQEPREADHSAHRSPELPAVIIKEKLTVRSTAFRRVLAAEKSPAEAGTPNLRLDASLEVVSVPQSPGVLVCSRPTARQAERELVRRSGKETDGIYSKSNRWLCRPAVRWLSKTPITPNMVTFGGLAVAMLSGYWFAQGYWSAYVLGALLYFGSVLIDEIDGMLARLTFRESAFGCWLETFVDYATYILLFGGMTIGLYRESGPVWLAFGGLLLFGTVTSFFVVSYQRKLATDPDRPNEYLGRIHRRLEADSGNLLSRFGRYTEFLIRKAAFGYWVLIFSVLGGLKIFFLLAAFGSNIVWPMALSFNRLFRRPTSGTPLGESGQPLYSPRAEEGR